MSDQYWIFDTFCVIFSVDVSLLDAIIDGSGGVHIYQPSHFFIKYLGIKFSKFNLL